jgi:hypothetical protein
MNQQERINYINEGHTEEGWLPLILELDKKLSAIDPNYAIVQIKEKFGGLRYYFDCSVDVSQADMEAMHELEVKYERLSYEVCEFCGSTKNVVTDGGWLKTHCPECK